MDFLLLREGFHRGDPRGALRWQQASGQTHHCRYARSSGEDWQVKRGDLEEYRSHGSARLPRAEQAQECSRSEQAQGKRKKLAADLPRLRA